MAEKRVKVSKLTSNVTLYEKFMLQYYSPCNHKISFQKHAITV